MIVLSVKAKHFKNTTFVGDYWNGCALEQAAKEQFAVKSVSESVSEIRIGNEMYGHERYTPDIFKEDAARAEQLKYSDEVIRFIYLTK